MSKKSLDVTTALNWPKERIEGVLVQLPSGNIARLRPVTMELFARQGRIPDSLTRALIEVTDEATPIKDKRYEYEQREGETRQQWETNVARESIEFGDDVIYAAFVEPKVVKENPNEDEISILQIEPIDRSFVIKFYNKGVEELKSFRPEQKADVESVPVTSGNGDKSK